MRDIKDIARYVGLSLIAKGLTVSPLKLQKLLYYVQSWYMVFNGRQNTLFAQAPQAWVNGPVYPEIYYQYRDKVSNMCDHLTAKDFDTEDVNATLAELAMKLQLTADETELLDSIVMLYGSKSQNGLIFLTHAEQPWVEAREGLAPYQRSEKEISLDTMHDYYKARHERFHLSTIFRPVPRTESLGEIKGSRGNTIAPVLIVYGFNPLLGVSFCDDTSTTSSPFATACCC